jgi:hypothetical protein
MQNKRNKTKKYRKPNRSRSKRRNRRTKHRFHVARGITCSMCEHPVDKENTFIPLNCLNKPVTHKTGVHRICNKCWWDPNTGFAREGVSHKCPGCVKGLPVVPAKKNTEIIVID